MLNLGLMRAICTVGLVALAGCQGLKPAGSTASSPAASRDNTPESQEEPAPKKKKTAMIAPADRARTPPDAAKKPDQDSEIPDIGAIGLDESSIRGMFGDPVSETDDAPAKRLSYRTGTCSVEFALYPDVDTRTYRTLTLEVKNDDGTAKGQRICVADLKSRIEDRRKEAR